MLKPDEILLAQNDLGFYAQLVYPDYSDPPHLRVLIDCLEKVEKGAIDRVMLFMPPGHGKSLTASQIFPAWYLGKHPDQFVACASHTQDLANDFGRRVRDHIMSPEHQAIFPNCRLPADSKSVQRLFFTKGGTYFAVGIGGPLTGRRAHLLLIDDPIKDHETAESDTKRKAVHDWYKTVARTRQHKGGRIVVIQTRWHQDDLAGWLIQKEMEAKKLKRPLEKWQVIEMPAIAEADSAFRKEGEALWPELQSLEDLERTREAIGTQAFGRLYQQRVTAAEGGTFKREWLDDVWHEVKYLDAMGMNRYLVVDPANSKKKTSDFTCMMVVGLNKDRKRYVLDIVRDRLDLKERGDKLFELHRKWRPLAVGYEQYGLQSDIPYFKQRMSDTNYHFATFDVSTLGGATSKIERIRRLQPEFEGRRIMLPRVLYKTDYMGVERNLIEAFVEDEYVHFPDSRRDDMLDCLARIMDPKFPTVFPMTDEESEMLYNDRSLKVGGSSWLSA